MAKTRAIVVGAGGIAGAWFPPLIQERVAIPAVVDLNIGAAKARIRQYGLDAERSRNLRRMLAKHRPDFVVDLTVPEAHCSVTCTSLCAGCHVIGEKPMASSMAEARKMVRVAEETGRLYMVSQSRRWNPKHEALRRAIAGGKIGAVTSINCDFFMGAHFGGFRDEMPSPLILDMSIHHFDLARFLTGADPVAVYAKEFNPKGSWYTGDAAASCVFEMSDGIIFTYRGSWCTEGCHTSWNGNWRIGGEKGTLVYENDGDPHGQVVAGRKGFHRPLKELSPPLPRMAHTEMHGALREMLSYLRTGKIPQTPCHDNIKSLAMVFAAIESSGKQQRIQVRVL